jgi:hypothetical protein
MSEHQEQSLLFQWAEHASGKHPELRLLYAIPNSGGFSGGFKANVVRVQRLKRAGTKKGVPDICLPVPRGAHHALYIELKAGKGKPSREQTQWLTDLWAQGNETHVCVGWESARDRITEYLALPRGTISPLSPSPRGVLAAEGEQRAV